MHLIPAGELATWLFESIIQSVSPNSDTGAATTLFSHYRSPVTVEVDELKRFAEEQRGKSGFERLPILKWMGRIKALGFAYILASQDATVRSGQGDAKLESRR